MDLGHLHSKAKRALYRPSTGLPYCVNCLCVYLRRVPVEAVSTSLVICSRNRPRMLRETVESVLRGGALPSELIVVDQSEQSHPWLAGLKAYGSCTIRYLWTNSVGASRARNHGAANATHSIVTFIDDDMHVAPNWYGALIRAVVEAGTRAAVTGRVLPGQAEAPGAFVSALVEGTQARVYAGRIGTDVLASCNFGLYRCAFEAVGGFDERLGPGTAFSGGGEDNDFGFRLLEAGFRIVHAPAAVIYHRAWRPAGTYFPLRWAYGRGQGGFYGKHLSIRDPYMLRRMGADVGLRVLRFPWRLLHRPRLAVADLVFTAGVLSGCGEWLFCRTSARRARNIEHAAIG
jgi:GT2 family glycosyltransferase